MDGNARQILSRLEIPTKELTVDIIQELLIESKRSQHLKENENVWTETSHLLWSHLNEGLSKYDDQLLCATCYYSIVSLLSVSEQDYHCNKVLEQITNALQSQEQNKVSADTFRVTSFMYGLFQSSFLTQKILNVEMVAKLLKESFKLLIQIAYDYSKFTFIAFKTLCSFKKVIGTALQEHLLCKDNQITLLNLTNHNWENPITGVRDLNRNIFQILISIVDENMYKQILEEINAFYWNKAKYLMLTEAVGKSNDITEFHKYDWIDGLVYSLQKPGLVSAGADLYYAVLNKLNTVEVWCKLFLQPVITILNGTSSKVIENFTNYWCLTTLKKYPSLAEIILNELENMNGSEYKLFSTLCILKQANKLGLIGKEWDSNSYKEKAILEGLDNYNNYVRMMAFDVVCISQDKAMPTMLEYDLIFRFLKNNVNSDCTVLRISMLNSFTNFLTRLHMTFLNYMKNDQSPDLDNLEIFCMEFQNFIVDCFSLNGNYQRKITCIKLVQIFMNGLTEVPRKRQKQTRKTNVTIIGILKEKGKWIMFEDTFINRLIGLFNDPAEDIRESVSQLLLRNFTELIAKKDTLNSLIDQAMKSMKSKFFYEISCGQTMFKLIINLLIKEDRLNAHFRNEEDIFNFAFNELVTEYKLKRGVVESIECGKQLYSFISILHTVLEIGIRQSKNIPDVNIIELIEVLNGISYQFSWDEETSTSSDFSKISDMIQNIIDQSGHIIGDGSETSISGLQQIVLNCLWLNVKASCDLSSLLIRYQKEDSSIEVCKRCLHIITHVLETCRHKGAIEAAGSALGQAIQHLTSLPDTLELSKLPLSLLKEKLGELIREASRMASVTRRGAGLSIMVHRIVSSDSKKGKPLFHYFMQTLLDVCKKAEETTNLNEPQKNDNEKDLPKAIYIHFLTRIVTDSSLASDMMFYSTELAEIAFDNLTSSHWQIRNAALQLYGALIPKLIGQKKASGTEDETIATVACDEFRTHSPKLWDYIQIQLLNKNYADKVQYHSNLVPILNLLANSAKRYSFSYDRMDIKEQDSTLLKSLVLLLDSPIYTVRRLTAQAIFKMFSFEDIFDCIQNHECFSQNFVHGNLMLIKKCYSYYGKREEFEILKRKYTSIFNSQRNSYLSRKLFEDLFYDIEWNLITIKNTLMELESNKHAPGVNLWANNRLEKIIENIKCNEVPSIVEMSLKQNDNDYYLKLVLNKIKNSDDINSEILIKVAKLLISYEKKFESCVVWEILYQISLRINMNESIYFEMINVILNQEITFKLRYSTLFAVKLYSSNIKAEHTSNFLHLAKIIYRLTDSEVDLDMRYIASIANNEIGHSFKEVPEEIKIIALKSAVVLLQDEDEDVRMESVKFLKNIDGSQETYHPFICLMKLFDVNFLSTHLTKEGILVLQKELTDFISQFFNSKQIDEYNPFANDSKNIYLEVKHFKCLVNNLNSV